MAARHPSPSRHPATEPPAVTEADELWLGRRSWREELIQWQLENVQIDVRTPFAIRDTRP